MKTSNLVRNLVTVAIGMNLIGGSILAQPTVMELEELLKNNQPDLVIKELKNNPYLLSDRLRHYYFALSFDRSDLPLPAISYAKHYLKKFGDQFITESLIMLEVVLRNHHRTFSMIDFSYEIAIKDIMGFDAYYPNQTRSLLHYVFLDKVRGNQESVALDFYLSSERLSRYFEYRLPEKLFNIKSIKLLKNALALTKNRANKLRVYSFLVEKLLQEKLFGQARSAISSASLIFGNGERYSKRMQKDLSRSLHETPLKVGMIVPLENSKLRYIADQLRAGFYYGLSEFNLDHVQLIFADPGLEIDGAKLAYEKLVKEHGVSIVLGPITKLTTEVLFKQAENYGVPYLSYSVGVESRDIEPYSFRFQRSSIVEAARVAEFSRNFLCSKKAVVFYDSKTISEKDVFVKNFEALGGTVYESYLISDVRREFIPIFAEISGNELYQKGGSLQDLLQPKSEDYVDLEIDVIFTPLKPDVFSLILNYAKVYRLSEVDFLGLSNLNTPVSQAWREIPPTVWFADSVVRTPLNEQFFVDIWRANAIDHSFNENSSYVVYGYLSAALISEAIKNSFVGSATLAASFANTSNFKSSVGRVYYNHQNELVLEPQIVKLSKQGFAPVAGYDRAKPKNCFN